MICRRRLLAAAAVLATPRIGHAAGSVLTVGIVPQQAPTTVAKLWMPLLAAWSAQVGLGLRFATAPDIPTFERRIADGTYDVAYMNPFHVTVAADRYGWRPFVRNRVGVSGLLVVRDDQGIGDLRALQGAEIAFPSAAAFAASLITRAELERCGIGFTPRYVGSHDSVYMGVRDHRFPAGGGIRRTFELADKAMTGDLKVLWESQAYTPHAFAAHPRVEAQTLARLGQGLLAMARTDAGEKLLQTVELPEPMAASSADWDDVRRLDIPQERFAAGA